MVKILIEVRFHGRGGQGAVTAADLLAVAGFKEGYYTLSFPMFGAEKRGTPVVSFLRISDEPIVARDEVYNPDYVVVLDPTVMETVNVVAGLKKGGMLIANYPKSSEDLKKEVKADELGIKVATINATKMAMEVLGRPITNTTMVGAFGGATRLIALETLLEVVREWFKGELAEKNAKLVEEAYRYMMEVCR
ncbi:pyruvate ferredoxin oxidoreductase, subunit gamma (porG) [Archaeoglobus fulgidus DSM 4304]|uniref:pyruvate synthase n=3 Tax=Archaeoglobus fulgidus TaxID=2234 RepID=O28574_ARCFU|nr:pyruvate ferredoxin oxidoreductase subunit gamma [Archaeoglobus fulgidus]AAB89550.1 pyruvate ferredoxin oxidoreductase, subunit gamma (porG) [Archaeoglobus fulgidus DSM 4304]AIG98699.1 2-oxoacid:acceptor oxidoreductase, gamma subunit, pyruvate/2-ketoisovalerate family [Archaeoglobus fulgidus DSM 8774]KUJ92875.1 MAG: Pyruvate ferredoxin oxidoreductase, subunit gamma (PorG) [Archaeoglobus fulgidus]KUK06161.1 MAG: Pyruvate ferredoxin oxidoreductase, subunit gamma (PorG) [Archaeoglobus fulgidus]